eukprot:COSAG01_NODE_10735_length_2092_cov_4.321626_1_plen_111_part_00
MGGERVTPEQQEPTSDLCRIRSMKMIVKSYSTYLSTSWLQCFWTTRWSSFPLPQDRAGKQGRGRGVEADGQDTCAAQLTQCVSRMVGVSRYVVRATRPHSTHTGIVVHLG